MLWLWWRRKVGVVGLQVWGKVRAGDGDGRLGGRGAGGHVRGAVAYCHWPCAVALFLRIVICGGLLPCL